MRRAAIAVLACLFAALCAAQAPSFLAAEPGFSELGSLAEPLDPAGLERAALLASGLPSERLAPYLARLGALLDELRSAAGRGGPPSAAADQAAVAEAVLTFLHKQVLRAYREDATTLDGILDTGLYNCVSSAVLYTLAARSLGIEAAGVRTSDHAFSTVLIGGRSVDVETTNPYGFDPGGKKEFKDSFGKVTGFAYVPPGSYGDRRSIGARDLVGLILSNRASELERRGRFAEATKLGADYAALCPGPEARAFLVDRINNLVADYEMRRDYADAEAAARAASAALPGEARLAALAGTASYNRAAALGQSGDWAAAFDAAIRVAADPALASPEARAASELAANALSTLAQAYARRGDFAAARAAVAERSARAGPAATAAAYGIVGEIELVGAANGLRFAEAAAVAARLIAAGEVSAARYAQAMAAIYGNEAGRIGSGGDWLGGAALAESGAALLKKGAPASVAEQGSLARLAQSLRRNFVAAAHNRFAKLYNSGDYAGAKAALASALATMPGEASLLRDMAAAEAALKR